MVASFLPAGCKGRFEMGKGIIGTITMFGTVAVAAMIGMMGVDFFFRGQRLVGAGFVVFAVLMVLVEEYVLTPGDVAGDLAGTVVDAVIKDPEETDASEKGE
ncbi:MAG: hypothetical protein ABEI77_02045 [Halorientalis sp.]